MGEATGLSLSQFYALAVERGLITEAQARQLLALHQERQQLLAADRAIRQAL